MQLNRIAKVYVLLTIATGIGMGAVRGAVSTITLFGAENVNHGIAAFECQIQYRNDASALPQGHRFVGAQLVFPDAWTLIGTGDVYVGFIDQSSPNTGRTGQTGFHDGTGTFQEPSVNNFLTGIDFDGKPYSYTHLFTVNSPDGMQHHQRLVYDFTESQLSALTSYFNSPLRGYWGLAIDADVYFVVTGPATLTLTTAPVPEASAWATALLLLLPFGVGLFRSRSQVVSVADSGG